MVLKATWISRAGRLSQVIALGSGLGAQRVGVLSGEGEFEECSSRILTYALFSLTVSTRRLN